MTSVSRDSIVSGNDLLRDEKAPKKGFLTKQSDYVKQWNRRYFVLKGNVLYYFKEFRDKDIRGTFPLDGAKITAIPEEKAKKKICI